MTIKDSLKKFVAGTGSSTGSRSTTDLLDEVDTTFGKSINPLIGLTIDTNISSSTDLLGKVVSDLQENIHIYKDSVEGTVFYLDDYTGFSGNKDEQTGNFIALHASVPNVEGVTIKAIRPGRTVTLDSDGILILRIPTKHFVIKFQASKSGYETVEREFNLDRLFLKTKPEPVPNEDEE